MSDILSLNCLFLGETPDLIFLVEIARTKSVGDLKKTIRAKNYHTCHDVDVTWLKLYRTSKEVEALDDDELMQALVGASGGGHEALSRPRRALSTIFEHAPTPGALHILVELPLIPAASPVPQATLLNCLVLGDARNRIFPVMISRTKNVGALRKAIKDEKQHVFHSVDADELDLYHISLPDDDELEHRLRDFNFGKPLQPTLILVNIFIDVPTEEHVHIIVRRPLRGVSKDRAMYLKDKLPAPSSCAKFSATQEKHVYLCSRPLEAEYPIPVTLMEPIFAEFLDDCQTYKPTDEDNCFVRNLSYQMSMFHPTELARMDEFREQLKAYKITLGNDTVGQTQCQTDDHLMVDKFPVVIAKGNNEIGSGGGDPFAQALIYYHRFIQNLDNDELKVARLCSVFPCFHIIVFGPCIGIVGSVFARKIQSEVLVPIIPLCWHSKQLAMQDTAARAFGSLRNAIRKLKNLYSKPIPTVEFADFNPECPSWQKYTDPDGESQEFAYEETQKLRGSLIFFGKLKTKSKRRICIKFVARYGADAHRFCASKGHAPELLAFEKLPGGWYMVVMEALGIDERSLSPPTDSYRSFYNYRDCASDHRKLEEAVIAFIADFHNEGFVHGDLRDVNLLVKAGGQDKIVHFMLLDFDWAGKVHETYYPPHVNRKEISRPSGARDGMEILQEHDLEMIRFLFHPDTDDPLVLLV